MTASPYLLVLISAGTHAWWNYLLKRSGGGQLVVGLSKIVEAVLLLPVFLLFGLADASAHWASLYPLAIGGAVLTLANYGLLAMAYRQGELSLVYPVSRGGILLFIPVLGYVAFGERVDGIGVVAFGLILTGILVLQLPALDRTAIANLGRHLFRDRAVVSALLAAAAAAGYTAWDKHAVQVVHPFIYFYAYTGLVALAYTGTLARAYPGSAIHQEFVRHRAAIVQIALLNTVTYLLVLVALRTGTSSYVVALRQLSVAIGALLGWRLLAEEFGPPKLAGVALIVVGSVAVALAG